MRCRGEGREEGAILGSTSESLKKEMEVINQNYQNAPKYQPAVPPKLKSKVNKNTVSQKNLEKTSIKRNGFIS